MPKAHVIKTWEAFNRHLAEMISHIPAELRQRRYRTNEPEPVTLQWLVEDHVTHIEYHLRQVVAW